MVNSMMLSYQRTLNGRKVLHSMIKVKDRCTLIDEMTNLMSGNRICTICYNVDFSFAVSNRMIPCLLERLKLYTKQTLQKLVSFF